MTIECINVSKLDKVLNHNPNTFNTLASINLQKKPKTKFQVNDFQPNENL